jgi:hypothetical protein
MKSDNNSQDRAYDGGCVLPADADSIPNRAQVRYLLGMGYSAHAIVQLNRGQAQSLIQAIADNGLMPVGFQFPNGAFERPCGAFRKWEEKLPKLLQVAEEMYYAAIKQPTHEGYASTAPKQDGNLHERMKYTIALLQQIGHHNIPPEVWRAVYDLQSLVKRCEPVDYYKTAATTGAAA